MTGQEEASLLERWRVLLPGHEALGAELVQRYAEPGRLYHDQRHLAQLLIMIDRLAGGAESLDTVRLAAWFHDAVYAVHRGSEASASMSNEEASAQLAVDRLSAAGIAPATVDEVARLVRLTERHDPDPDDADGALLCDADMSILAADPDDYRRYAAAIRHEHDDLDDVSFAVARTAFLSQLVGLPIFRTPAGRRLAAQAQANIDAELTALQELIGEPHDRS